MSVGGSISTMMRRLGKIAGAIFVVLSILASAGTAQTSDSKEVERYAEIGQKALEEGRYPAAEAAFEKLTELSPGTAEVHANLGAIYFQEKKFEKAVGALRQALKLRANLPKSESLLSISLSELGRYSEATPGLEKCFHHSTDTELKRMCGLQLLRADTGLKQENKSVALALELNRLYPDDPEVLYHTARVYGNQAFLNIQRLSLVAPDSLWKSLAAAEAYESQGSYTEAVGEYRHVLVLDPNRSRIHYRLGRTLLAQSRQNNSAELKAVALKEFEQELALDPSDASAAYELGESARGTGQLEEASRYFEQALRFYPDFEEAHVGLAAVLMAQGAPGLALPHLQRAVAINPGDDVAWYRLSRAQKALGNDALQQKALAEFQRLHEKTLQQLRMKEQTSTSEVTKQVIEPSAEPR
jgi:tetratricopeptide (TPR) repeat protein